MFNALQTRYRLYRLTGWSAPLACWHAMMRLKGSRG